MENKFEDFETYLKEQVNGYRMYPSGKVWHHVNDHLHGKQRFAVGAVIVMLLITALLFLTENNLKNAIKNQPVVLADIAGQKDKGTDSYATVGLQTTNNLNEKKTKELITNKESKKNQNSGINLTNENTNRLRKNSPVNIDTKEKESTASFANEYIETNVQLEKESINQMKSDAVSKQSTTNNTVGNTDAEEMKMQSDKNTVALAVYEDNEKENSLQDLEKSPVLVIKNELENQLSGKPNAEVKTPIFVNSNSKRTRIQYYATPSISYRSLFDSRQKNNNSNTGGVNDLDKAVFHKPALGLEAGVNWLIAMDSRLRLKTGVQLNYNRYNIKATSANPEVTSIALFGRATDLTSVSTLRNNYGFYPKWIENSNLQVSVPVGLEFTLANGKNVQLSLGSSLQPSLLLKNKMYLLSTDLKNYTQEPSLIRRFNINGAIESFITLNTKNARWHFGPQLRYQILSTYTKAYPFKENLFDYGFKIAYSKLLK